MDEKRSPLTRLVLAIVCLAIAGSFVAGIHYYAIDLPQQRSVTAPENHHYRACMSYQITCLDGSFNPDYCGGFCENTAGMYGNPANLDECEKYCIDWVTSH